jgi:hypothetical protein
MRFADHLAEIGVIAAQGLRNARELAGLIQAEDDETIPACVRMLITTQVTTAAASLRVLCGNQADRVWVASVSPTYGEQEGTAYNGHFGCTCYHPLADQRDGELKMTIPAGMGRQVAVVLYVVAMAAVIVGVDFVFFRNRFWERLIVNIALSWCS